MKIEAPKKVGIGRFDRGTNVVEDSRQPYTRRRDVYVGKLSVICFFLKQ